MNRIIKINDSCTGRECFGFDFEGPWVHEGGYPTRFYGGDEHWITDAQFGDTLPAFSFRFRGDAVSLYGHKTSEGARCEVTLDGKYVGELDYYSPDRREQALLFSLEAITSGTHTLRVQMLSQSNESAGTTHEASVDYAECSCGDEVFLPESIEVSPSSIYLEKGMTAKLCAEVMPDYADCREVEFSSSNTGIVEADSEGNLYASGCGDAVITVSVKNHDIRKDIPVHCEKTGKPLDAFLSDESLHTCPENYTDVLKAINDGRITYKALYRAFRRDRVLIKLDLFTRSAAVRNVNVTMSDLISDSGVISSCCADIRLVTPTLAHDTGKYVPDCINLHLPADLKPYSVNTVFALADIPCDAKAGKYSTVFTVTADGCDDIKINAELEVYGYTLPEPKDYPFRLELWQYPYSAERYYSGKTTEAYFGNDVKDLPFVHLTGKADGALRSQLAIYRSAGGKAVTVTCVEDPWNSQTFDPYPSMVKWHRHADGSFTFDYTDLDRWVDLNFDCGIDCAIKTFSVSCWGNRVTWIEDDGSVKCVCPQSGSAEWKEIWGAFISDYMVHMTERGLFERTYLSMDERPPEEIEAFLDLNDSIKSPDGKSFKTSLAVFRFEAEYLFDRIDDLSLALYMDGDRVEEIAEKRRKAGKNTTLYTCGPACSALSNEPYESEYSMMFTAMRGTDGFLRWALDSFNADPIASSQHRLFAAGDLYLIYPDSMGQCREAHTSHRFEKIAQGIRNVEKFRLLAAAKPEYADELHDLLYSFGRSGDIKSDISRVMDGLYEIAEK